MKEKVMQSTARKILICFLAGLVVTATSMYVRQFLGNDIAPKLALIGDVVAGLVSMLITLAIYLHFESQYYHFALERAAVFSEINHHVRNAVFPLCLAIQKTGDPDGIRISQEAMDRINVVMREAVTDVFSHKVNTLRSRAKAA
jgi:hypothetical protein